jgi:hypothetical protein
LQNEEHGYHYRFGVTDRVSVDANPGSTLRMLGGECHCMERRIYGNIF